MPDFFDRLRAGMSAGLAAYRGYRPVTNVLSVRNRHYDVLWSWWLGQWQNDPLIRSWRTGDQALYRNTMQLWRQASAVVNIYTQFVYPGSLSMDGEPLLDGSRGAIPLDPRAGGEQANQRLIRAFSTAMDVGQWSQYKSLRPKMAAILGDCLTELVEDLERGTVMLNTIDPRYVADLELDGNGNVKAYTLEYQIDQPASNAYGREVPAESYQFRKEVDGQAFRYFKNDKPYDFSGEGAVVRNLFGFAPAVWDRHELVAGEDRGIAAIEKTLRQTMQLNSYLSHAMDYQRKQFAAPVGIKGASVGRRGSTVTLPGGALDGTVDSVTEAEEARRQQAENLNLIPMTAEGEFVTVTSELGQTKEMLQLVMDSITAENPEARVGQELLQMTQLTAPGVERALFPILGLVQAVQANMDPQTIKLLQMQTAMMGFRLQRGDYPADLVRARPDRYQPFTFFNLDSYGKGLLDCSIGPRPMFTESEDEKAKRLVLLIPVIDSGDPWLMAQAGVPPEEIDRIVGDQAQRRSEAAAAFSVAGAGTQPADGQATPAGAAQPSAQGQQPGDVANA